MQSVDIRSMVALACRVLENEGHENFTLGHVSARDATSGAILVKRSGLGLGEVREADIVETDLQETGRTEPIALHHEMPIHTEIYRRREDVKCVVHTHSPCVAAFSASGGEFMVVSQDSIPFRTGVAQYESPLLVVTVRQGRDLARALGSGGVVVLRNHGLVTVGGSIPEAVFRAISLERSLQTQALASSFGAVRAMREEDAASMEEYFTSSYSGRMEGFWEYMVRQLD